MSEDEESIESDYGHHSTDLSGVHSGVHDMPAGEKAMKIDEFRKFILSKVKICSKNSKLRALMFPEDEELKSVSAGYY